jgi:hypothetical protein
MAWKSDIASPVFGSAAFAPAEGTATQNGVKEGKPPTKWRPARQGMKVTDYLAIWGAAVATIVAC